MDSAAPGTPRIYLDHAATTPVRPEVLEAMQPYLGERFGNPSSLHAEGRRAHDALEEAREGRRGALRDRAYSGASPGVVGGRASSRPQASIRRSSTARRFSRGSAPSFTSWRSTVMDG